MPRFAQEFSEIPATLRENGELRDRVLALIQSEPLQGKSSMGGDRPERLRGLLSAIARGETELDHAYGAVETLLPPQGSAYADDRAVFTPGWGERLVRTELSRFYNQAVLGLALQGYEGQVHIPHSREEDPGTACSRFLAGTTQGAQVLLDRLVDSYSRGNFDNRVFKVPHHPHCTHVAVPGVLDGADVGGAGARDVASAGPHDADGPQTQGDMAA